MEQKSPLIIAGVRIEFDGLEDRLKITHNAILTPEDESTGAPIAKLTEVYVTIFDRHLIINIEKFGSWGSGREVGRDEQITETHRIRINIKREEDDDVGFHLVNTRGVGITSNRALFDNVNCRPEGSDEDRPDELDVYQVIKITRSVDEIGAQTYRALLT